MEFHMKLPRNKREFLVFMLIISLISVNVIAPLIAMLEMHQFGVNVWQDVLKILPFIWLVVVVLVLITHKPAQWLTDKIIVPTDSFNAHILVNTLCNVLLMSIVLTVVATRIGTGQVDKSAFTEFFYRRPRNFAIAFAVEMLLAQPIARWVLHRYHKKIDKKSDLYIVNSKENLQKNRVGL